jgi:hypothetical protein
MKCIYCLQEKSERSFQHTEHVIPRAFGTFEQNLTLNEVVCDDCNQYFGDKIELFLGRDSLEGITRSHYGIKLKSSLLYKKVKMRLDFEGELEGLYVVLTDTDNRIPELEAITQVGFFHPANNKYKYFTENEIPERRELEAQGFQLNNQKIAFYGNIDLLIGKLKEKGMKIKIEKMYKEIINCPKRIVPVEVKARIDRINYRGITKIVFNYLAYKEGRDFALKDCFNGLRNFIRYDQGSGNRYFKILSGSFYSKESSIIKRKIDGHIILINWENNNSDLVGKLALYNAQIGLTYIVNLCRNYKEFWRPILHGNVFNLKDRTIKKCI